MAKEAFSGSLERIDSCCWRIPKSYKPGMRVDGRIFASEQHDRRNSRNDQAPDQVANVAFLPGIQGASLAMPDIHWGYGFCIGGVAATDPDEGGVISPGGVGYDINCGVRLVRSNLFYQRRQAAPARTGRDSVHATCPPASAAPAGTSSTAKELQQLLGKTARGYLLGRGLAEPSDIAHTEAEGRIDLTPSPIALATTR